MHMTSFGKKLSKGLCVAAAAVTLGACSPTFQNHGYIPPQEDLDSLAVGIDTRASVEESVGPPSSGGVLNEGGYYYVRSRVRTFGLVKPKEVERQVLAISFDEAGVVSNIERFGLEDGQVVPLTRRVTDTAVSNKSFLRQLIGNIGRVGAGI
jgi:outer membrane protein assembly factor BamE (lipoprotein component of BamABCDE complex)